MDFLQALILGVVQGLTEFLPISSSAHLVLFPHYMGWNVNPEANIPYDVIVHFGTLMAVLIFFYSDIRQLASAIIASIKERSVGNDPYRRLAWFLVIGTLPAGIVYLLIDDLLRDTLNSPAMVGGFLIVTAGLLVSSELLSKTRRDTKQLRLSDVLFIGFAQGLAILPGISRSGSTIAAGLFRGLSREEAARFSFLLSIPVILVGAIHQIGDISTSGELAAQATILIGGFIGASITGYFAIKYFIDYLKKHSLYVFALYCFVLGTVTLVLPTLK